LQQLGMVKAVATGNLDADPQMEIVFSREYASLAVFKSQKGKGLVEQKIPGLSEVKGLWNDIELVDVDGDGDQDIVACNIGLNQRFKNLSKGSSLYLFVNDFDGNGTVDNIFCVKEGEAYYPIHLKNELLNQIPALKKKVLRFNDYAKAAMSDLFEAVILSKSIVHEVNEYRSGIFLNQGENFTFVPLPTEVQYSEQKAVWAGDLNGDGFPDLVMGGNQYEAKPELGMNAASYGHVLINDGKGRFKNLPHELSGFFERGQIRDIVELVLNGQRHLVVLKNSEEAGVYRLLSY
jgi:enediyne biosynthesis protein E4